MSISNQFLSETLLDVYVKTPLPLKEQAMTKLAVQICQCLDFKKYIFNSELLKENTFFSPVWEDILEKQSSAMSDKLFLPSVIKTNLILLIRSIAIDLIIWNKKLQLRFDISPDVADRLLLTSDWTVEGKINEEKVSERLVQDDRIDVYQRYQLACLNCLEPFICSLWNQIPPDFQVNIHNNFNKRHLKYVRLWSGYTTGRFERLIDRDQIFQYMFQDAVTDGEREAVIYSWKALSESTSLADIMKAAQWALLSYSNTYPRSCFPSMFKGSYLESWMLNLNASKEWNAPRAYYRDILYYFFLQMSEVQRVEFFKESLNSCPFAGVSLDRMVVLCFLESPYQSYFIPILIKLWGILSEKHYGMIISILGKKFINYEKENKVFDYGYLLLELLEQTPEHYKRYIFTDNESRNEGKYLLLAILQKEPFEQRDVEIIKNILKHATVNERKSILYSQCGGNICKYLIEDRNRKLIDLILPDCLSEDEIVDFKKRTLLSYNMIIYYFVFLEQGNEEALISLLNWGCFPEEDIPNFKSVLIQTQDFKNVIQTLLLNSKMNRVNRTLEWCLPFVCAREQFKKQFVRDYLYDVDYGIRDRPWNLDAVIQWCGMPSEEIK